MDNELNPEQFLKHKGIYKKVVEDYNPAIVMNLMEEYAVAKFHEQEKNLNIDIVSQRYTIEDIERCVENWGLCKVEKEYIEKFLNGG